MKYFIYQVNLWLIKKKRWKDTNTLVVVMHFYGIKCCDLHIMIAVIIFQVAHFGVDRQKLNPKFGPLFQATCDN